MAEGDNAATGGLMVVLGIVVAITIGVFVFRGDMIDNRPDVSVEMPDVNITNPVSNPAQ